MFRHFEPFADLLRKGQVTVTTHSGMSLGNTLAFQMMTLDRKPKNAAQIVSVIFGQVKRKLSSWAETCCKVPCPA